MSPESVQTLQIVGAVAQLFYFAALPVAALFAAWQFKRFVDAKTALTSGPTAPSRSAAPSSKDEIPSDLKIDEFVD